MAAHHPATGQEHNLQRIRSAAVTAQVVCLVLEEANSLAGEREAAWKQIAADEELVWPGSVWNPGLANTGEPDLRDLTSSERDLFYHNKCAIPDIQYNWWTQKVWHRQAFVLLRYLILTPSVLPLLQYCGGFVNVVQQKQTTTTFPKLFML